MATQKKSVQKPAARQPAAKLPVERTRFKSLLLANPNYFGNLMTSPLKPVKAMTGNTTYEELMCVGYNPDENLLKAVVYVKRDAGYNSDICGDGSTEYVRFYLSFDNGTTWEDQGGTQFTAYNVPGDKPLEFAVTVRPKKYWTWCFRERLPLVRAILSWEDPITGPDFPPTWGNVVESHIQIHPFKFISLGDLFQEAKIQLPLEIAGLVDLEQKFQVPAPAGLTITELLEDYKDKDVPQHRSLYPELQKYIINPGLTEAYQAYGSKGLLEELKIDLGQILDAIEMTDGDTGYEELECVGLDPNSPENLVGILRVKLPYGYNGGQCKPGSMEYVAFWIDWQDGTGWHWAGTAQVNVHDFIKIPKDGLSYAVSYPINLAARRKPCGEGPVTARVRAILSWHDAPPFWNPDYRPTWGNRVETHIHIPPGDPVTSGDYTPYLEGICGVDSCRIDQTTGFAPADRPFGGTLNLFGYIPGAPNRSIPAANRLKYRISVRPISSIRWQHITDSFEVTLEEQVGSGIPTSVLFTQFADSDDYYTYQDAPPAPGIGWRAVFPSHLLGRWNTAGKEGLWEIMVEALDPSTTPATPYVAGIITCQLGGSRQNVIIKLDNTPPTTTLTLTHVSHDHGVTWESAGDCGTYRVGDILRGDYAVSDKHFGSIGFDLQPSGHAHGAAVTTSTPTAYPAAPTSGVTGTWELDTGGDPASGAGRMEPCGYTLRLVANDRTIVSCNGPWSNINAILGFCLEPPAS